MQVQKEIIRNRIIDSAIDEFYQFGYKGASVRRIAESAGITPGNIYAYFSGKEELFRLILTQAVQDVQKFIEQVSQGQAFTRTVLHEISTAISELYFAHQKQFLILMSADSDSPLEEARENLLNLISLQVKSELLQDCRNPKQADLLSTAMADSLLCGILHILYACTENKEELCDNLDRFIQLIFGDLLVE